MTSTTDPAARSSPVSVRAARATVPGSETGPVTPHPGPGGKTSALARPAQDPRAGADPQTPAAAASQLALDAAAGRNRETGLAPAGRARTPAGSAPSGSSALSAGQAAIAAAMSEGDLEEKVDALCAGFGILRFHYPDSRRVSERGLPDDILIGPRGVLWRELKNMKRKLTPEQEKVGEQLTALGQDWAVWRPVDLLSRRIENELRAISGLRIAGGAA